MTKLTVNVEGSEETLVIEGYQSRIAQTLFEKV